MVTVWFLISAVLESREVRVAFTDFLSMRISVQNFAIFLGFLFASHTSFRLFNLYQSRRLSTRNNEVVDVFKASTMAVAILAATAQVLRIRMVTPLFLSVFWVGSTGSMVLSRTIMRAALAALRRRGRNLRTVLVVGANSRGVHFARKLESQPELGYRVAGFVDERDRADTETFKRSGYRLVADLEDFAVYLRAHVVDEVAVFLPLKSLYLESAKIIAVCEEHGIAVRVPVQSFNLTLGKAEVEPLESDPVVTIYTGAMHGFAVFMKRLLDITISVILFLMLLPVFGAVALLIKGTSKGPVLFAQERLGLNKRLFRVYKFRTMVHGAEKILTELEHLNEAGGPVFKMKRDPRMTRLGKFLRKTSIDELPQLFNVLKGDMSLVGPRPLPVRDYEGFNQDWHRRRFSVRPGITCLWQVNGRSSVPFQKWMELDMEYIDRWSLWLDFKIVLKTIPAVLKGAGAS
ncbi:MAG TPA: sugar transferase [Syntrophorhabdales bacterium]|nr:sugar transferase [Syntrophorhabdales bacterium]